MQSCYRLTSNLPKCAPSKSPDLQYVSPTLRPESIMLMLRWHIPRFPHSQDVYGATLCAGAAALLALFLRTTTLRASVIFPFLLVVIFIALRFGAVAAIVGTSVSAAIFSAFYAAAAGKFCDPRSCCQGKLALVPGRGHYARLSVCSRAAR